jgi:crossover junction endodeoxyribonuclease RuvC
MVILGIDPGTATIGYGVIEKLKGEIKCIEYGCIETDPKESTSKRLLYLEKELEKIIKKYNPAAAAIEDIFFFKNLKTVIKVSQAKGVILLSLEKQKIPIFEYTPLQIKMATTGFGKADKKQMQKMVQILLNLKDIPKPDDAADGLAIAMCCANGINKIFKS